MSAPPWSILVPITKVVICTRLQDDPSPSPPDSSILEGSPFKLPPDSPDPNHPNDFHQAAMVLLRSPPDLHAHLDDNADSSPPDDPHENSQPKPRDSTSRYSLETSSLDTPTWLRSLSTSGFSPRLDRPALPSAFTSLSEQLLGMTMHGEHLHRNDNSTLRGLLDPPRLEQAPSTEALSHG